MASTINNSYQQWALMSAGVLVLMTEALLGTQLNLEKGYHEMLPCYIHHMYKHTHVLLKVVCQHIRKYKQQSGLKFAMMWKENSSPKQKLNEFNKMSGNKKRKS